MHQVGAGQTASAGHRRKLPVAELLPNPAVVGCCRNKDRRQPTGRIAESAEHRSIAARQAAANRPGAVTRRSPRDEARLDHGPRLCSERLRSPQHDIGEFPRFERSHMPAQPVGDRRVDRVLRQIATHPIVVRLPVPGLRGHNVGELPGATHHLATAAHPERIGVDDADCPQVLEVALRLHRPHPNARASCCNIVFDRRILMVNDRRHRDHLFGGVYAQRHRGGCNTRLRKPAGAPSVVLRQLPSSTRSSMFTGDSGRSSRCRLCVVLRHVSTCDGQLTDASLGRSVHDASVMPWCSAICRAS